MISIKQQKQTLEILLKNTNFENFNNIKVISRYSSGTPYLNIVFENEETQKEFIKLFNIKDFYIGQKRYGHSVKYIQIPWH